jgi:hypothetical protein
MAMDKVIEHICAEVGVSRVMRVKMEEYGICTVDDLMKINDRIERRELSGIWYPVLEMLQLVVKWRKSNEQADILRDFNGEVLDKLMKIDKYIKLALGRPHDEEIVRYYEDVEGDNDLLKILLSKCKEEIMVPELLTICGKFHYDSFLEKAISHFHALVGEPDALEREKLFIVAGRTQAGKTSVKGVVQSMAGLLKIPVIILTKGVAESIDLHAKLVALSAGTLVKEKHIVVASSKMDGTGYKLKDERISEALEGDHGGTLVIADTAQQILKKACLGKNITVATTFHSPWEKLMTYLISAIENYRANIPGGKFILIVDEADDMFRTIDKHQVFEKALQNLLNLKPSMASTQSLIVVYFYQTMLTFFF